MEPADVTDTAVTIFVHVHYTDIWADMCALLQRRMNVPFGLVLTTSHRGTMVIPETPMLRWSQVLRAENRGRDILPFLHTLAGMSEVVIGLKLHTKKSPQRVDGALWLEQVLDSLVPARWRVPFAPAASGGVARILGKMQADSRIGLVAPARFALSVRPWVHSNAPGMIRIMRAAGHELAGPDLDDARFAAGSMFWFRRAALEGLLARPVLDLFEAEAGQLDGTAAHAAERLFPVEAGRRGYVSLPVPALLASRPGMPLAQLQQLARRHSDVSTSFFPGPNTPAREPPHVGLPQRAIRAGLRALRT